MKVSPPGLEKPQKRQSWPTPPALQPWPLRASETTSEQSGSKKQGSAGPAQTVAAVRLQA
jgi:hypothetical protein